MIYLELHHWHHDTAHALFVPVSVAPKVSAKNEIDCSLTRRFRLPLLSGLIQNQCDDLCSCAGFIDFLNQSTMHVFV